MMSRSSRNPILLFLNLILLGTCLVLSTQDLQAQDASTGLVTVSQSEWILNDELIQAETAKSAAPSSSQRLRQGLLLAGMTTTTIGYGLFSMKYNTWRARSEASRLIYLDDVEQNAILYTQSNQELDEIQSYLDWQNDYDSAITWRERAANAGLLTGLIAIITVLDAAVTWDRSDSQHSQKSTLEFEPVVTSGLRGFRTSINF